MTQRILRPSWLGSMVMLAVLAVACDVEPDATEEPDLDELALRDLSAPYRGAPVLIENLDEGTCLSVDVAYSPYPAEVPCDPTDPDQLFGFEVQTYVGGIGFVYEICAEASPSYCLTHVTNGTVFFDDGQASPGFSYQQVRIQHDENDARIEFRDSGKCLTKGPVYDTPVVETCDWFGDSPQHYRLHLVGASSCAGRCGQFDAAAACQCDAVCSYYGDCCPDHGSACG